MSEWIGEQSQDRNHVPGHGQRFVPAARPSNSNDLDALCRFHLLAGLPETMMRGIIARIRFKDYAANELVVDVDDVSNDVFFILEGAVRVVFRTAFGYESILNDLGSGDFFGEIAAIDGLSRSASVTALRQTRLGIVPAETFMGAVFSCPEVAARLLRLLSTRLRLKDERLIEFCVLSVRQRLIAELLRLSRNRGGGERVISPPPTQHVLAARIGSRRETISRELTEMSRAGLLTIGRRSIVLHVPERLRSEVEAVMGHSDPPD
jgi:CRP/FNR family cyclic AMP-dependent transcriptional regulator